MLLTNEKLTEYTKRLLLSRLRILSENGFYGLLLMHMKFSIEEGVMTAATDGETIVFDPVFMDKLSDEELDFILMHEVLHVALKHCSRGRDLNSFLFNIACDIVVNSNIMHSKGDDVRSITVNECGESMHLAPNGKEGYLYTAEEVYDMFLQNGTPSKDPRSGYFADNHSRWGSKVDSLTLAKWDIYVRQAAEAIKLRKSGNGRGILPLGAERILEELTNPRLDWRKILNEFVQEDVNDYSFCPPDKRFQNTGFLLPDYNEKEDWVKDVLFMIDTSGSMSDKLITEAFSEIKGAIEQYGGKLRGKLGFFDVYMTEPIDFASVQDLMKIKPKGGGGTDFGVIFKYVKEKMADELPSSIVIMTDGYCPFPEEGEAMGIPVLWVINNEETTPPWGRLVRIQ